jgi:hypothetical protein
LSIPQRINHIKAIASVDGECPVMPRLGPSGTAPVGLGKTLPGVQKNKSIKHRRRVSRSVGESVPPCSRDSSSPVAGGGHASRGEGGPAGTCKAQIKSGASAWRETSEASRDRQPGPRLKLGPSQSQKGRDRYVKIFPFWRRLRKKDCIS